MEVRDSENEGDYEYPPEEEYPEEEYPEEEEGVDCLFGKQKGKKGKGKSGKKVSLLSKKKNGKSEKQEGARKPWAKKV